MDPLTGRPPFHSYQMHVCTVLRSLKRHEILVLDCFLDTFRLVLQPHPSAKALQLRTEPSSHPAHRCSHLRFRLAPEQVHRTLGKRVGTLHDRVTTLAYRDFGQHTASYFCALPNFRMDAFCEQPYMPVHIM